MNAKVRGFISDHRFKLLIIASILAFLVVFFAGEYIYDKVGETLYNRRYTQRMAELERLKTVERSLAIENERLKAKNAELSRAQSEKDAAQSEKDKQQAEEADKKLEDKLKDIDNTPDNLQVQKLCEEDKKREKPRGWSFCK